MTDIYVLIPNFNQVLRIGNLDPSKHRALTLEFRRALFAGWLLRGSYTYSRAAGEAETYTSLSRDDPAIRRAEHAVLDRDQRHRVAIVATAVLPKGFELGGQVVWESGTPYSVEDLTLDDDDIGNVNVRTAFPTGRRNDQRNGGCWRIDARVAKRFAPGPVQIVVEAAVGNLLDEKGIIPGAFRPSNAAGLQLLTGPDGLHRTGLAWQLGTAFYF